MPPASWYTMPKGLRQYQLPRRSCGTAALSLGSASVVEVAAAAMGEAVAGAVGPAAMAAKRETQQEVAADTAAVAQVVSPVRAAAVMGVSDTFHPAERSPYRSDRRHLAASSSTERGRRSW
eukprot:3120912-Prymnesium_polylepis.1